MRWQVFLIGLLLVGIALAAPYKYTNRTYDLSDVNITYHFAVNITVSQTHAPTNYTVFNMPGNFSYKPKDFDINYTNVPKVLQGVTPKLPRPLDYQYDKVRRKIPIKLDPRTCANELAYCYQVVDHLPQNRTTFGMNYTGISSYILPNARARQFVCIGNDTSCVKQATNCFCPTERVPPPPVMYGENSTCDDTAHTCLSNYGNFVLCKGKLATCQKKYIMCGCGRAVTCSGQINTCVNERDELVACNAMLGDCLGKYKTCYCGRDMLAFQKGCPTKIHTCVRNNQTFACEGSLNACAVQFDKCDC